MFVDADNLTQVRRGGADMDQESMARTGLGIIRRLGISFRLRRNMPSIKHRHCRVSQDL